MVARACGACRLCVDWGLVVEGAFGGFCFGWAFVVEGAFGGFCFLVGRGFELFVLVASSGTFFHITRSMGGVALLSGLYVPSIRGAPPPARSFDVVPGLIVCTDSMPFFLFVVSFSFVHSFLSLDCDLF